MNTVGQYCCNGAPENHGRRDWLKAGLAAGGAMAAVTLIPSMSAAASMGRAQRDAMTPDQVVDMLREGNERFRSGAMRSHDFLAQKRATAGGQNPAAVILSCIDSRTPAEIIFDAGIGDVFGARVAGNIATSELIGSMEFACAVAGAKLVLVMGHTACGAIAGAIDNAQLGNLTGLLDQIQPAVSLTQYDGEKTGTDPIFVDAVARTNVLHNIDRVRKQSPVLAKLEEQGDIRIMGAMYDLANGKVTFLEDTRAG